MFNIPPIIWWPRKRLKSHQIWCRAAGIQTERMEPTGCKREKFEVPNMACSFCLILHTESLCFCTDVRGLFEAVGLRHQPDQWRLFLDNSTRSLKAVLLHSGNQHTSIPIGYSVHLKEDYGNVKIMLDKTKYDQYKWDVCGEFKMLWFLLGLLGGYTKYPCCLCLWGSRDSANHYVKREWQERSALQPSTHNVKLDALVSVEKVLLSPLHIKHGLIKQFHTALEHNGEANAEIRAMFLKLSDAQDAASVFVRPQVKQMFASGTLEMKITVVEKELGTRSRALPMGFWATTKLKITRILLKNWLKVTAVWDAKCHLSCTICTPILEFFWPNLGAVSEKHGDRFH